MILICGILILVYQKSGFDVAMGVALVTFCAALGAGAALTILGLAHDRKLAALQIDFVSKVSHELKTPLTSIRLFVDTLKLKRVKDEAKVEECLEIISKETDRLSQLIGRLLSWGAMEAGAFRVELEPREPGEIVRKAIESFEPRALGAGAKIELSMDKDLPLVDADEQALADSILNLLSNALRYGGEDKCIWVRVKRQSNGGVAISVRDTGVGIELQHHTRIFERFYRADERYARSTGGTGLGLAIARHVVLAHGGAIDVDSTLGEGSTFTIRLPARSEESE